MAQAEEVATALGRAHPGLATSVIPVTTSGDRDVASPVTALTEVGAFVRAVQQAVLDGEADLAVHSCKDLPVEGPERLVAFFPGREEPWDVLCGHDLDSLPRGATVGTGSPRRAAQMKWIRPDTEIREIRGNVDTRLSRVASGGFDAVVLAAAGLRRLGLEAEIGYRFPLHQMVPAPAQAALAVEAVAESRAAAMAEAIDDPATRRAVEAERLVLAATRAGCRAALGVLGEVRGPNLRLTGFVEDERGPRHGEAEAVEPEDAARALQGALGM